MTFFFVQLIRYCTNTSAEVAASGTPAAPAAKAARAKAAPAPAPAPEPAKPPKGKPGRPK